MTEQQRTCVAKYFDSILDVWTEGIYISDHTGMTLKVNKAYEHLTGLRAEEMVGRYVTDLKAEGKYDVILNPDIVRTGKPQTSVQITKVGRKVILNGYPVKDETGKVVLVVTFVRDVTVLCQIKEQLTQQQELIDRYQGQVQFIPKETMNSSLVSNSKKMKALLNCLQTIAQTDATTLLLGETGSGKGVIARKLHDLSKRNDKPFFKIDCTSIPDNLFESELFGFEAGAFSGANTKGKPGLVEMAHGGTLFLDEIGDLPLPMQGKLLRVLQDQEVMRLGSTKVRKVDVRFIAATNRDLDDAVRKGTFRSDLYYRIRVAVLCIPALRERTEDILPLTDYFLERFNTKYKRRVTLSDEARAILQTHTWPGNIREMENLIQSLIVTLDKDVIDAGDLPVHMQPALAKMEDKSLNEILTEVERDILKKMLDTHGSVAAAANKLKVDRVTIYRKLKKYGLM